MNFISIKTLHDCISNETFGYLGIHGFSTFNGVIILWDNDFDSRITMVIEAVQFHGGTALLDSLVAVHEHKGSVDLFWADEIPDDIPDRYAPLGDEWSVYNHVCPQHLISLEPCFVGGN